MASGAAPLVVRVGRRVPGVHWPMATGPPSLPAAPHTQFSLHPPWPLSWGTGSPFLQPPCPAPWVPKMALTPTGSWWCLLGALRPSVARTEQQQT